MTAKLSSFKIGLLATGDEIALGDILNTNAQRIAQQLTNAGYCVGNHLITTDQKSDIEAALQFLLLHHHVIIITGGLGPTSDDRTRFALSEVIQQTLLFDEASWQAILAHFAKLKMTVHDSNKQQALFPKNAQILSNPNGTAAGCYVYYRDRLIFLLPGPPRECLPMFEQTVLPKIRQEYGQGTRQIIKWRLIGVLEADIAAQLDQLTQDAPCTTGYRIDYPYLEVKLYVENKADIKDLLLKVNQLLAPYQLDTDNQKASELLTNYLISYSNIIHIQDNATAGFLESKIISPALHKKVLFNRSTVFGNVSMQINGLAEAWMTNPAAIQTQLTLHFQTAQTSHQIEKWLPLRHHPYTINYAVEYAAWELYQFIKQQPC